MRQHDDRHDHGHTHGVIDPSIATTERGIWAVKWSFVSLCITALIQVFVVWLSGSAVTVEVRHQLLHHLPYLEDAIIHVDPVHASGKEHHRLIHHAHDALPVHSHA